MRAAIWVGVAGLLLAAAQVSGGQSGEAALRIKVAAAAQRDLGLNADLDVVAGHIELLTSSLSLPSNADLRVVSAKAGFDSASWMLRLDCSSRADCLPFHAILHAKLPGLKPARQAAGPAGARLPVGRAALSATPLARIGQRVQLVEERPGMRLVVNAVCLQSGTLGDAVRVRNLATHRILLATITGKQQVRVGP